MDFTFTKEQIAVEEKARKFALMEIAPVLEHLEQDLILRREIFQKMASQNLMLLCVPPNEGGDYTDFLSYALSLKAISSIDAGIGVTMSVTNMVAEAISTFGSKDQKLTLFSKIKHGQGVPLAFALTEKEAGSDAKSIKTEAILDTKDEDYYLLSGEKQFITNADMADTILVMAKIQGTNEITAFLIDPSSQGFKIEKKERKMGLLSANLVDFSLNHFKVHKNQILGKVGQGFEIAMRALDAGRIGISAQALGIAEAAYEAAKRHSQERYQFGRPLADNQVIAFKLADMFVKLCAGRALLYKACWQKERQEDVSLASAVAKVYCTESANEIVNEALQIFGGYGYVKDYPLERYYRDVRATTLYEGTSEIQRLVISRNILKKAAML